MLADYQVPDSPESLEESREISSKQISPREINEFQIRVHDVKDHEISDSDSETPSLLNRRKAEEVKREAKLKIKQMINLKETNYHKLLSMKRVKMRRKIISVGSQSEMSALA